MSLIVSKLFSKLQHRPLSSSHHRLLPVCVLEPEPGGDGVLDGVQGAVDVGRGGRDGGGGADAPDGATGKHRGSRDHSK